MRGLLAPFVLRREKSELADQLVTKTHHLHTVEMAPTQAAAYRKAVQRVKDEVLAEVGALGAGQGADSGGTGRRGRGGGGSSVGTPTSSSALGRGQRSRATSTRLVALSDADSVQQELLTGSRRKGRRGEGPTASGGSSGGRGRGGRGGGRGRKKVSLVTWADGDEADGDEVSYGGERTEGSERMGTPDVMLVEDEGARSDMTGSRKRSREPEGGSSGVPGGSSFESVKEEGGEEVRGATPVGPYMGGSMEVGPSSSRKSSSDGMVTEDDSSKPSEQQQEQQDGVKQEASENGGAAGDDSAKKALGAKQAATLVAKLGSQRINNIFTHLRKLCQHPLLVRQHFSDEIVAEMADICTRNRLFGGNCTLPRVLQELRGKLG